MTVMAWRIVAGCLGRHRGAWGVMFVVVHGSFQILLGSMLAEHCKGSSDDARRAVEVPAAEG